MILISINNIDYKLPNTWDEIIISHAIDLNKVVKSIPEFLSNHYIKGTNLTVDQIEFEAPLFYTNILKCLLRVDKLENVLWSDVTAVYKKYCEDLVFDLIGRPANVEEIDSFDFHGEKFVIPESMEVLGEKKEGATLSTIQFTEVADLEKHSRDLDGGLIEVMPLIIAILCLKKGEDYIEDISLVRGEKFKELPMSIAWSVFFSFTNSMITSILNIPTFPKGKE